MKQPSLMGILNVTPDSFYDGGKYLTPEQIIKRIDLLIENKVDIIDIGAESTKPFSDRVTASEEIKRLQFALKILKEKKVFFSIDTQNPATASFALDMGASMINDIGGFSNLEMIKIAAKHRCQICIMHMLKNPKTMQINPLYPNGIINSLIDFFSQKIEKLLGYGIKESNIIIDPGIGFGKTVKDNLTIIKNLSELKRLNCKILIGLSRKSFMKKILGKNTDQLLPATLIMNTIALLGGADIIRVHDVIEHNDLINLISHFNSG
jgi:dihydropteroate synthase